MRWGEALDAADALLTGVYRFPVAKALDPQDPADFLVLQHRLAQALKGLTGKAEAQTMKHALAVLDVNWAALTEAGRDKVIAAARAVLAKPPPSLPEVAATFEAAGKGVVKGAKVSFKESFGAKIGVDLTAADQRIMHHAATSAALYVRDQYGVRADAVSANARKIVSEGLAKGLGRYQLAQDLREGLAAQGVARSDAYWNMAAGVFVNRSRVYGSLSGFAEAKITHYKFDAVLDEVTTLQCRFMHGRVFEVGHALGRYAAVAASANPEDVKVIQPWMGVAKNDAGELALHYKDAAGARVQVATVTGNALGQLDATGSYANAMDDAKLAHVGLTMPPLHGNCRSTVRPVFGAAPPTLREPPPFALTMPRPEPAVMRPPPRAPVPVSPEQEALTFGPGGLKPSPIHIYAEQQALLFGAGPGIVPKPLVVPTAQELLVSALEQVLKLDAYKVMPFPDAMAHPYGQVFPQATGPQTGGAKQKKAVAVPLEKLVTKAHDVPMWNVMQALKYSDGTEAPHVIKKDGKFYVANSKDHAYVMGQHALGLKEIQAKVIDLDAVAAKAAKPKKPPKVVAPIAPPALEDLPPPTGKPVVLAPPGMQLSQAEVMVHAVPGPSGGSNQGQTYEGADGVKRFVKLYKDPGQAYGEHLANQFYKDLGLGAPESVVFPHDGGRTGYGSQLVAGETLGSAGLTKERAKEFMKGFVADVLTANWDAAGKSLDNAFVTFGGKVLRIDNGGAFLFRAQGGPKDDVALSQISEWNIFFSGSNPSYKSIANTAGYFSADDEDFKGEVTRQIKDVLAMRAKAGGWKAYVDTHAAGLAAGDRARMTAMLEKRTELLSDKLVELTKPKPPKPKPGEGYFAPALGGAKPRAGLRFHELPEHEIPGYASHLNKGNVPKTLPSGEGLSDYRKRAAQSINLANADEHRAIIDFTGCGFHEVRDYEEKRARGTSVENHEGKRESDAIARAFAKCTPEPGTVYRGLHSMDESFVNGMLENAGVIGLGRGNVGATSSSSWNVNVATAHFCHGIEHGSDYSYKVVLKIQSKTAIPVETISAFGKNSPQTNNECERFLSRDSKYRITGASRWKGKKNVLILEMEEVDE